MVLTNLGIAALVRNGKKAEGLELHKEKEKQNF